MVCVRISSVCTSVSVVIFFNVTGCFLHLSTNLHIQEFHTVAIQGANTSGFTYDIIWYIVMVFLVDGERECKCLKNVFFGGKRHLQ